MSSMKVRGSFNRNHVIQWFNHVLSNPEQEGTVVGFVLCHIVNGVDKEIYPMKIGSKIFKDDDEVKALAQIFFDIADRDATDLPGTQTYRIYVFYSNHPDVQQGRIQFTSQGNIISDAGYGSESPTETGRLQQKMRIDDGLSALLLHSMANLQNQQNAFIKIMGERSEVLMQENMQMFGAFKEMMRDEVMRRDEAKQKHLEYERSSNERKAFLKLLPALANTIFGREIFPVGTADTAIIETLAENLKAEDIPKLQQMNLPPEVMGVVMHRFAAIMEEKNEAEARIKKLSAADQANANGERANHELDQ